MGGSTRKTSHARSTVTWVAVQSTDIYYWASAFLFGSARTRSRRAGPTETLPLCTPKRIGCLRLCLVADVAPTLGQATGIL